MLATDTYLMANLFPHSTGLPFIVWISVKGNARHDVRVKVSLSTKVDPDNLISVAIRPQMTVMQGELSADHLRILSEWVTLNFDALLAYWNEEIDTLEVITRLRKLDAF